MRRLVVYSLTESKQFIMEFKNKLGWGVFIKVITSMDALSCSTLVFILEVLREKMKNSVGEMKNREISVGVMENRKISVGEMKNRMISDVEVYDFIPVV